MSFEIPHPEIELPPGEDPLVLVAPSTAHDSAQPPRAHRARGAGRRAGAGRGDDQPGRAAEPDRGPRQRVLVDWLSYSQLMPAASLVISHGGHGTVGRALAAGTPLLISPFIGDMSETAMRVSLGQGRPLAPLAPLPPRRRCAGQRGASSASRRSPPAPASSPPGRREHDGAERGAELVEQLARTARRYA